jgi:hypothetical protein
LAAATVAKKHVPELQSNDCSNLSAICTALV